MVSRYQYGTTGALKTASLPIVRFWFVTRPSCIAFVVACINESLQKHSSTLARLGDRGCPRAFIALHNFENVTLIAEQLLFRPSTQVGLMPEGSEAASITPCDSMMPGRLLSAGAGEYLETCLAY